MKILEGTVASVPPQGGRKHPHQELIQIDTTNILFICGGAFEGLDKIIETRMDQKSIGFNADIRDKRQENVGELLRRCIAGGFYQIRYDSGVHGSCADLCISGSTGAEMIWSGFCWSRRTPSSSQYQKLFELDGVDLKFDR